LKSVGAFCIEAAQIIYNTIWKMARRKSPPFLITGLTRNNWKSGRVGDMFPVSVPRF